MRYELVVPSLVFLIAGIVLRTYSMPRLMFWCFVAAFVVYVGALLGARRPQ